LAWFVRSLPTLRNTLLRYLEPLGAPEDTIVAPQSAPSARRGVKVRFENVTVMAAGHVILDRVSVDVAPGEHVGVVGLSGAGKSALVGLLLGWHQPVQGRVQVDDLPLDANRLTLLRAETAWVDPQVHLFQATLLENLCYGNGTQANVRHLESVIEDAGLLQVLQHLPDGLQTGLGEGGALVAGGEGQRVRIGRALARQGVRLAILDEPARGLARDTRRSFLTAARAQFRNATLFFVTHDVSDTLNLDRIVVLEAGRIVEQGAPRQLWTNPDSRYRALFGQDLDSRRRIWADPRWRHVHMMGGVLTQATTEECEWTHA
jgi:ATP-binding cassette subfamily B protein